jgi:hypothetical protein
VAVNKGDHTFGLDVGSLVETMIRGKKFRVVGGRHDDLMRERERGKEMSEAVQRSCALEFPRFLCTYLFRGEKHAFLLADN